MILTYFNLFFLISGYLISLLVLFSYKFFFSDKLRSLSTAKALSAVPNIIIYPLTMFLVYTGFIARGFEIFTPYINIEISNEYLANIWLLLAIIYIYLAKKKNTVYLLSMAVFLMLSVYLVYITCLMFFYLWLEILTYFMITIVFIYITVHKLLNYTYTFKNYILVTLIINFFFSLFMYILVIYAKNYSGFTNINTLHFFNKNFTISFLFLNVFLLKLFIGPWFFWNVQVYTNIPLNVLILYILSTVYLIIPKIIELLYIFKLNEKLNFIPLLSFTISLFLINSKLYDFFSTKIFFLFSSFTLIFTIVILLCFLN